jgi:hypothetical protein
MAATKNVVQEPHHNFVRVVLTPPSSPNLICLVIPGDTFDKVNQATLTPRMNGAGSLTCQAPENQDPGQFIWV